MTRTLFKGMASWMAVFSLCCFLGDSTTAFRLGPLTRALRHQSSSPKLSSTTTSTSTKPPASSLVNEGSFQAPLTYVQDFYPVITLRFPDFHDVCLSFSLDTGASMNAINAFVAYSLCLPRVGQAIVSGLGGSFPTHVYQLAVALGDCPPEDETRFPELTAAALQHNRPTNGLLGLPFFDCFAGGVDFDWHGTRSDNGPSVRFHHDSVDLEDTMTRVSILRSDQGLLFLNLNINGVDLQALLDTGSPITVLNPQAARLANIDIVDECVEPLKQQEVGHEVLTAAGVDGSQEIQLRRSKAPVSVSVGSALLDPGPVYVGTMPGMAVLQGHGQQQPAALLGLDFLRRCNRMVLRSAQNEVWFEPNK